MINFNAACSSKTIAKNYSKTSLLFFVHPFLQLSAIYGKYQSIPVIVKLLAISGPA